MTLVLRPTEGEATTKSRSSSRPLRAKTSAQKPTLRRTRSKGKAKGKGKTRAQAQVPPFACFECDGAVRPGQWMLVRAIQRLSRKDGAASPLDVDDAESVEQLCPKCAIQDGRLADMQSKASADDRCSTCGRSRDGAERWIEMTESIDLLDRDGSIWCASERTIRSLCDTCYPRTS